MDRFQDFYGAAKGSSTTFDCSALLESLAEGVCGVVMLFDACQSSKLELGIMPDTLLRCCTEGALMRHMA